MRRTFLQTLFAGLGLPMLALSALAQATDYPAKTLTIVVPFAAGSGTDQMARGMGQALTDLYKVPVVVDNKPGANGFIASQFVARATADGYTMLMTTNTTHAANEPCTTSCPTTR